jgi:ATP-dependent Lon protease
MSSPLAIGSTVSIFQVEEVVRALEKSDGPNLDGLRRVYQKMLEFGAMRLVTKPSTAEVLDPVKELCPNFEGVLEDISNYIELSLVSSGGLNILPVLLAGDPGVGKTHFSKCLASALNLPYQFVSMGTMSAGWVLSGSAPTWQGARHGKIAEALIDNDFASILYMVDELDKTGGDSRYDPFGALLQLLEKDTARHFKDEYLDVEMDASSILWVATANDLGRIPDYILSRMAVYEVPAPTEAQAETIAGNIYNQLRAAHNWPFEPVLRSEALGVLCHVAPREMKKKILDGMACALRAKRDWLAPGDIRSSHVKSARSIGFQASF